MTMITDKTDDWDFENARKRTIVQTSPGKFEAQDKQPRDTHNFDNILLPKVGAFFRHYKGGNYQVIAVAAHSESLDPMVIYREVGTDKHWARPASMWFDWLTTEKGREQRFTPITSANIWGDPVEPIKKHRMLDCTTYVRPPHGGPST